MEIKVMRQALSVCRIRDISQVDLGDDLFFIGKTDEELSLVCSTRCVPEDTIQREDGWRAFRVEGALDFSLVGILSRISAILADRGIGIFAVSTYRTDYILTREADFERALAALRENGYGINQAEEE